MIDILANLIDWGQRRAAVLLTSATAIQKRCINAWWHTCTTFRTCPKNGLR